MVSKPNNSRTLVNWHLTPEQAAALAKHYPEADFYTVLHLGQAVESGSWLNEPPEEQAKVEALILADILTDPEVYE